MKENRRGLFLGRESARMLLASNLLEMDRSNKHSEEVVRYDTPHKDRSTNVTQIPKINKAFVNAGIGKKAVVDGRHVLTALLALEHITGQKPIVTRAKKWVDGLRIKKKMPLGCKPTLRHSNLCRFADRLINQVFPLLDDGVFRAPEMSWTLGQRHFQVGPVKGPVALATKPADRA